MRDFRRLLVWQRAHRLALTVYERTASFPATELCGLTRQLRRAASSVGANIAEGCGRDSQADVRRFLSIAFGSASELEYHLLLAYDLRMLSPVDYDRLSSDVAACKRMIATLMAKIAADQRAAE